MSNEEEVVSFDDASVQSSFDPNRKTERFDPVDIGKVYQITFEMEGGVPRKRHYGRRYAQITNHNLTISADEERAGLVILPDEETGEMKVYGPVSEGKEKWGYRRCTSHLGFCPACVTGKAKLDRKKDKRFVQPAADVYGANIYVWLTDDKGNLLDKHSKRPIDADGRFVQLDSTGVWDQESYIEGDERGTPDGKVHFYQFGADKFVQIRQIKRTSKKGGPFTNLNMLIECTDPNFKKVTFNALRHEDSAANSRRPLLDQAFQAEGIKSLGKWLCKEETPDGLVYFYGLESQLLGQYTSPKEQPGDGLASPPKSKKAQEPSGDVSAEMDEEAEETPGAVREMVAPDAVSNLLDEL